MDIVETPEGLLWSQFRNFSYVRYNISLLATCFLRTFWEDSGGRNPRGFFFCEIFTVVLYPKITLSHFMEYSVKNVYKNVACKKEHIMQEYQNFKNKLEIKNLCAMILQNCQKLKRIKLMIKHDFTLYRCWKVDYFILWPPGEIP